jgi:hypothetical protein
LPRITNSLNSFSIFDSFFYNGIKVRQGIHPTPPKPLLLQAKLQSQTASLFNGKTGFQMISMGG